MRLLSPLVGYSGCLRGPCGPATVPHRRLAGLNALDGLICIPAAPGRLGSRSGSPAHSKCGREEVVVNVWRAALARPPAAATAWQQAVSWRRLLQCGGRLVACRCLSPLVGYPACVRGLRPRHDTSPELGRFESFGRPDLYTGGPGPVCLEAGGPVCTRAAAAVRPCGSGRRVSRRSGYSESLGGLLSVPAGPCGPATAPHRTLAGLKALGGLIYIPAAPGRLALAGGLCSAEAAGLARRAVVVSSSWR